MGMDRRIKPDHAAGKGFRYLRKRGLKEFTAHAVEKVKDEHFDYQKWICQQKISSFQAGYQRKLLFSRMPKVYVLIADPPGDCTDDRANALRSETVRSVRNSTYPYVFLSQALNSQIDDEDYLTFLQAGDLMERNAVFEMIQAIQGGADAVYTDEDSYERKNGSLSFSAPLFKPDYNPDFLRSCNYIGSLFLVRVGVIRSFYREGGQNLIPTQTTISDPAYRYALILRCTRRADELGGVGHVAKVLCHTWAENAGIPETGRTPGEGEQAGASTRKKAADTPKLSRSASAGEAQARPRRNSRAPRTRTEERLQSSYAKWNSRTRRKPAEPGRNAGEASPGPLNTMRAVLETDLKDRGCRGSVEDGPLPGTFHVAYEIEGEPLVSIIIPNRDHASVLENCIQSIRKRSTWKNLEIIVVENNSRQKQTSDLYRKLEEKKEARIVRYPKEFHFSRVINEGARQAAGEYLILMNNDVTVRTGDWIERLLAHVSRPGIGAAGPKLLYPDGRVQSAGIVTGIMGFAGSMMVAEDGNDPGYMGRAVLTQDISAVTAACMMVRRTAFREAGGFPNEFSVALGDVDFCLSLGDRGYRIVFEPSAVMIHHESLTRGAEDTKEKKKRFAAEKALFRKKRARLLKEGDPAYNPNLSRRRCDWSQQT